MPPLKKLHVFIFKGGEFLGSEMFEQASVKIGREGDVDLTLESGHVSRHHATITQDGETIIITDAGSKNGMYVNDRAATKMVMGPTDKVSIGEFTLKMKLVGSAEDSEPAERIDQNAAVLGPTIDASRSGLFDAAPNDVTGSLSLLDPRLSDLRAVHEKLKEHAEDHDSDPERTSAHYEPDVPPDARREASQTRMTELPASEDNEDRTRHEVAPQLSAEDDDSLDERTQVGEPSHRVYGRDDDPRGQGRRPAEPEPEDSDGARRVVSGDGADAHLSHDTTWGQQLPDDDSNVGWSPSPNDAMSLSLDHNAFVHGDEDDHDDEDANFVPPYSLPERLVAAPPGHGPLSDAHVEMLTVIEDKVIDVTLLRAARGEWSVKNAEHAAAGIVSLRCGNDGECLVVAQGRVRGALRRGAQSLDVKDFMRESGGLTQGIFKRGESLAVHEGRTKVYLRHVYPPALPPDGRGLMDKLGLDAGMLPIVIASLLAHALMLIIVSVLANGEKPKAKDQEFVVAVKQEPQLQEKPKDPPKPPDPPEPPPERPEKPQKHKAQRMPRAAKHTKAATVPEKPQAPVQAPPGILGLLSKKGATQAPGPAAAVAAVSNLNAVKVPGASGGYRVTGLIGKLPASAGVQVGGGGGGIVTKGANNLLRGGGGGAGKMADVGDHRVEGLVQKVARGMHMNGGSLDRASIERVVNEHTDEIQRCYERELLHDSSLAGKVQVEWVIGLNGSVVSVRQMFSSVNSPAVVRCIMDSIKTWEFPKPQGGQVVVDFPFILKGMDF